MEDPSQMSDEELNTAITGEQPEETPTNEETPPASPEKEAESTEEPTDPPKPPETEEPAQETSENEEERPPSRRETLRVQNLLKKYGAPPETPPAPSPQDTAPNFRDLIDADDAVYDALDQTTAKAVADARKAGETDTLKVIRSSQWETLLKVETPQVFNKYPSLNPKDKEHFHEALSDAMNRRYLAMVGYDPGTKMVETPDISYLDFVESEFELANEIASTQIERTTKNIVSQAANTGLRPDGSSAKGMDLSKHPQDMTIEELNASINATMPRDSRGRFTRT